MRRAERLFRLVDDLRTRPVTRAEDLAQSLEVSTRTIYRDIAHLQASGLPIDGEAGVGYILRPGFDLPSITFTQDQVEALAVALAFAESLDDTDLATAAREVRAKLQAVMPQAKAPTASRALADAPYRSLRRRTGAAGHARLLRQAIRRHLVLRMAYADGSGALTERDLQPLVIWSFDDGWMVSGWCRMRQGFRTFRLDRIRALVALEAQFDPSCPATGLRAFLAANSCEGGQAPL